MILFYRHDSLMMMNLHYSDENVFDWKYIYFHDPMMVMMLNKIFDNFISKISNIEHTWSMSSFSIVSFSTSWSMTSKLRWIDINENEILFIIIIIIIIAHFSNCFSMTQKQTYNNKKNNRSFSSFKFIFFLDELTLFNQHLS